MIKQIVTLLIVVSLYPATGISRECIVLLHGLARTSNSMNEMEQKFTQVGYVVANIDYPSTEKSVSDLAKTAVQAGLDECKSKNANPINFVTHSLGGILVRLYYKNHRPSNVKRVVMLGPPNQGSEVVDNLKDMPGYELINGPAGMQLGTREIDIPRSLGPVNFELGIIAGTESINLILSSFLPNPDDGKVSLESAKVEGMCGFIALPVTHPFMMANDEVIYEVSYFLRYGRFSKDSAIINQVSTDPEVNGFCISR